MDQQDLFISSSGSKQLEFSFWKHSKVLDYISFFGFVILLAVGVWRHELWIDELHCWNLARSSGSLAELFRNIRYEGHPPLWYLLMFVVSKITGVMSAIQFLHFMIACIGAFMLVFRMHIYPIHKLLILCGYFFLYEYGVLSRNYSMAILFAVSIVLLRNRDSKYDLFFYYFLLVLISSTHILGLFLGLALHFAFTIKHFSTWYSVKAISELALGIVVVLPALYFIFPPSTGSLNLDYWTENWSIHQFRLMLEAPLKAFLPLSAWWLPHSWDTQFLLKLQERLPIIRVLSLCISISFLYLVYYLLRPHRLSLNVFFVNFFLTICFACIFPLTSVRYVGFIYIGFIVSLLIGYHTLIQFRKRRIFIWMLLVLQVISVLPAYAKDLTRSFSQASQVNKMVEGLEPSALVTDFWTLNYISAAIRQPVFCVGYNKPKQFLLWDREIKSLMEKQTLYSEGLRSYFDQYKREDCYLLTNQTIEGLLMRDAGLSSAFELELLRSRNGSIEKFSDLYLFRVFPNNHPVFENEN